MELDPKALSGLHDATATILELTDAHRAACLESGYSPTAAEAMAVDFHRMMLHLNTGNGTP